MEHLEYKELKATLKQLEHSLKCGIWSFDMSTGKVYCSRGILDILDCDDSFQEMDIEQFFDFIHPDDQAIVYNAREKAKQENKPQSKLEYRLVTTKNVVKWVCAESLDNQLLEGRVWGIFRDISNEKEYTQRLIESETRLTQTLKDNNIGFWELNMETNDLYWSDEMYEIYGVNSEEFTPELEAVFALTHPGEKPAIQEKYQFYLKNPHNISKFEYRIITSDDQIRWLENNSSVILDNKGRAVKLRGMVVNITDKKLLEDHRKRSQRMDSIGMIASGVAHDLSNTLAPVYMYSSLLKHEALSHRSEEALAGIEHCTKRAMELVEQIVSFAKGGKAMLQSELSIHETIESLEVFAKAAFPKNINISVDIDASSNDYVVVGEQNSLYQSLLNIVINAKEAIGQSMGQISLEVKRIQNNKLKDVFGFNPLNNSDQYLLININDNGPGIPENIIERIFEPYFTTKKGASGIGLLNSQKTIMDMHGSLHVSSEWKQGANFSICIPCHQKGAMLSDSLEQMVFPCLKNRKILLVDDDQEVLTSMSLLLEHQGIQVLSEMQGTDAIAVFASAPDIDLIVVDLQLSDISGLTLIKTFRKMNPQIKIVVCSGLTPPHLERELMKIESLDIVKKPFLPTSFIRLLAKNMENQIM